MPDVERSYSSTSLREPWAVMVRRKRLMASILGGLLPLCLLYCLIAPNQYEATARIALRTTPDSSLSPEASAVSISTSILSAPLELETLAGELRSEQLAWRVISQLKLYEAPGFMGNFARRFPGYRPEAPSVEAQAWLLERFQERLNVQSIPRTFLIQIRFRSRDAALSAAVVNALLSAYNQQDSESQVQATMQASAWLNGQLKSLKLNVEEDERRLTAFQDEHGILQTPSMLAGGQTGETEHSATLTEIDALGKELVDATTDRILREAEYRAASQGNPELVIASDPGLQSQDGNFATLLLEQIHATRSQLEQEQAQLSAEHGPNFPRVVEIRRQMQDLDGQKQAEDAKLVERLRIAWQTAADREQMVRKSLEATTGEGMKQNEAAVEYAVMRQEADSSHELYMQVMEKVQEAGLAAGTRGSRFSVVDFARQPAKPVAPNLPLYMAITFFAGLWLAAGGALMAESMGKSGTRTLAALLAVVLAGAMGHAQAPTPALDGLPTGVARIPFTQDNKVVPNPREEQAVQGNAAGANQAGALSMAAAASASQMPVPLGPGDFVDISEYQTPDFHTVVRVSTEGTVTLPMVDEVKVGGMDDQAAAHAIAQEEPKACLLLVGWFDAAEDALDEAMRARIDKHPRIHCTGFVEDTAPYYRAMDIMVLPTWREGFPNVVLEAGATGIPVITTISTGSRDSVVPEVTGLLIPPGYPEGIREAVLELLRNPERRLRMGAAARAWVREHYANEDVLGRIAGYYKGLLKGAEGAGRAAGQGR